MSKKKDFFIHSTYLDLYITKKVTINLYFLEYQLIIDIIIIYHFIKFVKYIYKLL